MAQVLRLPQIDLATLIRDQNPVIDLKTQTYENSTRNFLKALTAYKNHAISTISDRRKHQATEKKKALERIKAVETETNQRKVQEIELVADLEREKEERKDAELSVAAFKRQLLSLQEKCTSIEAEIEQYRTITDSLRREKNKERLTLSSHASEISPELRVCEKRLACSVEGIEKDRILIRFWQLYKSDPEREASFVVDLADDTYKVVTSSPQLPVLPLLVDSLHSSHDIYQFIKLIRQHCRESI